MDGAPLFLAKVFETLSRHYVMNAVSVPASYHFGVFEVNCKSGELRKHGSKIKLSKQAFKLLSLLLQRPGVVRTRTELQRELWPAGTFVEFEHSLNKLIHEIRTALGDAATCPRYIETVAGQGYRFIAINTEVKERAGRARPGGVIDSLAVLPFANLSGDAELDFISKRIAERIIDTVSRSTETRVTAFSTVQRYRGKEFDPRAVGEELRVSVVMAGESECRNDELFLHLELVDVADGTQLWGAQFQQKPCCEDPTSTYRLADEICAQLQPVLDRQRTSQDKTNLQVISPSDPWVA